MAMLAAVPCPSVFLLCNGLLPVSGLGLVFVNFAAVGLRDSLALIFAVVALVHAAAYGAGLYWLSGFLARRLSDRLLAGWRGSRLLIAALLVLAVLPVYSFDCMDGASSRWCNWFQLHAGWFRLTEACGDFHW